MKLKLIIAATLMVSALPTQADFVTISRAIEISPSRISVPTSENSRIAFSECEDCETISVRLTPQTRYSVNGQTVKFDKFRQSVLSAKSSENAGIILMHHLESDTVVSVTVKLD